MSAARARQHWLPHFLSPGGGSLPLIHFSLFIATLRGRSQGLHVTGGSADFEVGHIQLSCLGTVTLSESCHVSEPSGFLAGLLAVASEMLWEVPRAVDAAE